MVTCSRLAAFNYSFGQEKLAKVLKIDVKSCLVHRPCVLEGKIEDCVQNNCELSIAKNKQPSLMDDRSQCLCEKRGTLSTVVTNN